MTNPWKNIERAFEPMFDETATISSDVAPSKLSVNVCTDITDDAGDGMMDADYAAISMTFRLEDQATAKLFKRGDRLTLGSTAQEYAVTNVKVDSALGVVLRAREV